MSFTHGNVSQGGGSLTALGVFFILSWLLTHLQAGGGRGVTTVTKLGAPHDATSGRCDDVSRFACANVM